LTVYERGIKILSKPDVFIQMNRLCFTLTPPEQILKTQIY
jgi:hypothetical protein